ncbi:MAG: Ig-like domain-containing protein, partial [Thermoplasmata archaeon]|nr:Ig-like domain-containing protein [Thermoplasmata archaeon]
YTVKMVMAKSYGQFFLSTLGVPIIPKAIWEDHLGSDGTVDTLWNDVKAATGTGPFYYAGGEKDVYREVRRFDDYWGKNFTTPSGHRLFPQEVTRIYFKLYSSLDTAILALKSGQVDHIPWTVTPGYVSDLISNPNTDVMSISDNGYFYLAFNMKREPMNQLAFRKAVSHCIDKVTIVERYMGGFGQAGDSVEPPFWTDWYNSSVTHYEFDTDVARQVLEDAGYTGFDSTLKMPDGRPVPPLVILTPPADYDPVRIKAGEVIAKNLRSLGMDAVAKAVDFDTLVAKMNAFDYDMLIIGWSLSGEPVGNVFDILGPEASQNYFAFWSVEHDNPWYKDIGGVSTLADEETQALANQVYDLGVKAKESFDREEQIKYTKWAQAVISDALPVNVLYYRVNNYAISTAWNGWIPFMGELLNGYSVAALSRSEETVVGETLTALINVPEKLPYDMPVSGSVVVIDGNGMPVEGATVSLQGSGVSFTPTSGTTDATGVFMFKVTGDSHGYVTIRATAESGGASFTAEKVVSVYMGAPPTLYLSVVPDKIFLDAGESTTLHLKVVNQLGEPVSGVNVTLDTGLMGYGTVDHTSVATGPNGEAEMVYTAPSDVPINQHLQVRMSLSVDPVSPYSANMINTVTQYLVVKNTSPSEWHFVQVEGATRYSCDASNNAATITIRAIDENGNGIGGENLTITYTNPDTLSSAPSYVVTEASGYANITVQFKDGIDTNATFIWIKNDLVANGVGAGITLLYKGSTIPSEDVYGGLITINQVPMLDPDSGDGLNFTIKIYDLDGNPPTADVPVALIIGEPFVGPVAGLESAPSYIYSSLWDYAGIQVFTTLDGASLSTGGYFLSDLFTDEEINETNEGFYTSWDDVQGDWWAMSLDLANMSSVTAVNGEASFNITAEQLALTDSVPSILALPLGTSGFYCAEDYSNFYWISRGATVIKTDFVMQRTQKMASVKVDLADGIVRDMGDDSTSSGSVTVYDQDNNPVSGVEVSGYVRAYGESPYFSVDVSGTTNGSGAAEFTITGNTADGSGNPLTNPVKQPMYLEPVVDGAANIFASTEIFDLPIQAYAVLEGTPLVQKQTDDASVTLTVKVFDENGDALRNTTVLFSADRGTLSADNATTDDNGTAQVTYTPTLEDGEAFAVAFVSASVVVEGYGAGSAVLSVVSYNPPAESTSSPSIPSTLEGDTLVVAGTVSDEDGIASVSILLDGVAVEVVNVTGSPTSYSYNITLTNISKGEHTLRVVVTDSKATSTTVAEASFSAVEPPEGGEMPWMMIIAVVVVMVLIVVVAAIMKARGGEGAAGEAEEPVEPEPEAGEPEPEAVGAEGGGEAASEAPAPAVQAPEESPVPQPSAEVPPAAPSEGPAEETSGGNEY